MTTPNWTFDSTYGARIDPDYMQTLTEGANMVNSVGAQQGYGDYLNLYDADRSGTVSPYEYDMFGNPNSYQARWDTNGQVLTGQTVNPNVNYNTLSAQVSGGLPAAGGATTANTTATTGGLPAIRYQGADAYSQLYQDILRRSPEAGAADYWRNLFGGEIDENELSQFRQAARPELDLQGDISKLYKQVLGRKPEDQGLAQWENYFTIDGISDAERAHFIEEANKERVAQGYDPYVWGEHNQKIRGGHGGRGGNGGSGNGDGGTTGGGSGGMGGALSRLATIARQDPT